MKQLEVWRVGRDFLFQPRSVSADDEDHFHESANDARNPGETWTRVNGFESYAKSGLLNPATSNASARRSPMSKAMPTFTFRILLWQMSKPDRSPACTSCSAWQFASKFHWKSFCWYLESTPTR